MFIPRKILVIIQVFSLVLLGITTNSTMAKELEKDQALVLAVQSGDLGTIDAMGGVMGADRTLIYHVYRGLVRFPIGNITSSEFEPDLATKWEVSPDKLVWTFHLRKGVKWHWGYGEVTSEDVVYSLNRTKNGKASAFNGNYVNVKDARQIDKHTVQIRTHKPDPFFLNKVANYHGGFIVCKKAIEEAVAFDKKVRPTKDQVIGTGPFKFLEYKSKDGITMVRNEDYWEGKPTIEKIIFKYIPDQSARDIGLLKGELAAARGIDDYRWIKQMTSKGIIVDAMGPRDLKALYINLNMKPFDDKRVREAIAHCISQDTIVSMQGEEISRACTSPVPSGLFGHVDAGWAKYDFNPAKAKKLLTEAGYPNGLNIKLFMSMAPWLLNKMIVFQDQLKECGVSLEMTKVGHSVYRKKIFEDLNPIVIWGGLYDIGTTWLRNNYHSESIIGSPTGVSNFMHYSNQEVDRLIELAETTFDEKAILDALAKAQKIIVDELPAIPVVETNAVIARNQWLDLGYEPKANFLWAYEIGLKTRILKH